MAPLKQNIQWMIPMLLLMGTPLCQRAESSAADAQNDMFFARLDAVEKVRPFLPATVGTALGVSFAAEPAANKDSFLIYRSPPISGSWVDTAELRISNGQTLDDGLLVLDIASTFTITSREITARYGQPWSITPPNPHAASAPFYYTYRGDREKLSFGFQQDTQRLVIVVIDRVNVK